MRRKYMKAAKMNKSLRDGKKKLKSLPLTQSSEVMCFICDGIVADKGVPLLMTYTPYSNTDLPTKIGQLMGDRFMVIVAVNDVLCKRCSSLMNQLDKLEYDSLKVRTALTEFLKIKYQLSVESDLEDVIGDELDITSTVPEGPGIKAAELSPRHQQYYVKHYDKFSVDLKYDIITSQNIKTEKLETEDCGSVTDVKMVSMIDVEQYDIEDGDELDSSVQKNDNYEVIEEDESLVYEELVDDTIGAVTIYECRYCSFSTSVPDTFIEHLKSHSKQNFYKCSECYKKFETQQEVECHVTSIHGASEVCYDEDCRELENDPDYYPSSEKMYECNMCSYHHNNKKTFDAHVRKHMKLDKFVCSICSKVFKHRITLKKHMLSHKTFKCVLCSALFQNEVSLVHHFKVHSHDTSVNEQYIQTPSTVSIVDMARLTHREESISKPMSRTFRRNVDKNEYIECKEFGTYCRQEDKLLTNIQVDHKDNKVSSLDMIVTDIENVGKEVSGNSSEIHISLNSETNLSHEPSSIMDINELKDLHIKQCVETVDSGAITTTKNDEKSENDKEARKENREDLATLGIDCNSFHKSECVNNTVSDQPVLSAIIKDKGESSYFPETRNVNKDENLILDNVSHKVASKKVYVCSLCGLKTSSETHIKRHFKCHIALQRKTYKCHICERVLTTRSNLKRHLSLHENCSSGEIECNMCNEMLTDRLHLKHHMEIKHPESYQCSFCDRRFDSKKSCREHELTHPSLQCDVCHKMFLTEGRLKNHKVFMHSEPGQIISKSNIFKCHICLKILTTYHNLKRHLRNHEKCSGAVTCLICNEELTDKLHLRQHVGEKHPENHQCSFCHKVFGNRKSCKAHEMTHPERFVYKCKSCDKLFLTEARLKRHQDIMHRDPHCRVCGKEISNPLKLLDHERRHERHKVMFPCDQCPKIFRTPSGLKYHMSVHTGKYAVYCEICGKGLHSEVVLAEHKATHTKEVRYTCEKCGRTFSSNSTYRMHRLWHDNPLPYKCNICDRKFKHTSILAVHKRRAHTGERPYKCPHCNLTFSVSSTLNKHIILHTKEYPYRCMQCEKGFTTRTKIARHMAKVHNDFEMLNSKKRACEYKMVLHPSELSGTSKDNNEETFIAVDHVLRNEKVGVEDDDDDDDDDEEDDDETQTAALEVLDQVTVDPAQAAIFTIFQQDLPSSEFTLNEFDTVAK